MVNENHHGCLFLRSTESFNIIYKNKLAGKTFKKILSDNDEVYTFQHVFLLSFFFYVNWDKVNFHASKLTHMNRFMLCQQFAERKREKKERKKEREKF